MGEWALSVALSKVPKWLCWPDVWRPPPHPPTTLVDNSEYDLAYRLAAVMLGSVPVTINWQADDLARVQYKVELTAAALIVHDAGLCTETREMLGKRFATTPVVLASTASATAPLAEDAIVPSLDAEEVTRKPGLPAGPLSTGRHICLTCHRLSATATNTAQPPFLDLQHSPWRHLIRMPSRPPAQPPSRAS